MVSEAIATALKGIKLTVLILVLVEDGLGEDGEVFSVTGVDGLNPCFSGGWSRSSKPATDAIKTSLNPCFSGGWSRSSPS